MFVLKASLFIQMIHTNKYIQIEKKKRSRIPECEIKYREFIYT